MCNDIWDYSKEVKMMNLLNRIYIETIYIQTKFSKVILKGKIIACQLD